MAGNPKRIFKILLKVNKSPSLLNASAAIGNVTERSRDKLLIIQYQIFKKFAKALKLLSASRFIQDIKSLSIQSSPPLPKQIVNYWHWYQQITGLDKVEIAKKQVIIVQNKLFECQNQRRGLTQQISLINGKLKEIYSELIQTKRDDPKFVQLTILENKSLQEHSRITGQVEMLEDQERDHFTQLTTSIKEYHECQLMNTQKFKYLSILASAILAIISLTGSSIYNYKIISDIKYAISSGEKSIENILNNKYSTLINIIQQQSTEKNSQNVLPLKEEIEYPIYYIGLGCVVTYILYKIFVS